MKSRWFSLVLVLSLSIGVLFTFFSLLAGIREAAAAPMALTVTSASPTVTQNDLDMPLVITGTGFVDGATAMLGDTSLAGVTWISAGRLEATLPWGVEPGVYALTVTNPGGASATLPDAMTLEQGIGAWTHATGPEGGYVGLVFVHPITPTMVFAAPDSGGLFRSLDSGESWEFTFDQLAWNIWDGTLSLGADGHTLYAATGGRSVDVWRSDDNGTSWQPIPIPDTDGQYTVYAHPTQADTVFAIVNNGGGGGDGLFYSTNRGQDWLPITEGISGTIPSTLGINPHDPLTMLLGTVSGELYLSTDGGMNWSYAAQPLSNTIGQVIFHPSEDGEVWLSSRKWACGVVKGNTSNLSAWTAVEDGGEICTNNLTLAPAAWGDVYSQTVFYDLWKIRISTDGGLNWEDWGGQDGANPQWLVPHPTNSDILYLGNELGVWTTEDFGASWSLLQDGFTGFAPDVLAVTPGDPGTVYGVDRNNPGFYKLQNGGAEWSRLLLTLPNGSPGAFALDPFTPQRMYAATNEVIYISEDGGQTWPFSVTLTIPEEYSSCWSTANVLVPDPFTPGVILAGLQHVCGDWDNAPGGLYLSADYGEQWIRLMAGEEIGAVRDIAYDWGTSGTVYAAANTSGVLRSINGGLSWAPANSGLEPWGIVHVETEPAPPYRVYIGEGGGLWRSENQGDNWSNVGTPPGGGYGTQALHFTAGDLPVLFIATGSGLYESQDGGSSWSAVPTPLGTGVIWSLGSDTPDERTVLYAAGAGGIYRLSRVAMTLSGTVTDNETGLPVVGAQVQASSGPLAFSDVSGAYSLTLSTGTYTLTAFADSYYAEMVYGVELVAKDVVQNFALAPAPPVEPWMQVNQDGFGDPGYQISVLETFQPDGSAPYLYAGVWGNAGEATMWRTSDGWNWEIASPGFLTPTAFMMDAQVFDGQLYLGLSSPAQLWRTDGETWQAVDTVGFGDSNNYSLNTLEVFDGILYAALLNDVTGLEIWRSDSGNPGTWSQVNEDGFGGSGTWDIAMEVFQGYLYAGFDRDGVSEMWRTEDGTTWELVFPDGLGNPNNGRISMAEFERELYLGIRNIAEGGQIWRSGNGIDWELVMEGGFGDLNNGRPYGLIVADGALYVAFGNPFGAQVWRSFDGDSWQRVNLDGWGDSDNFFADYNDKAAAVFNFNLYVGTFNNQTGGEVWKLFLAEETRIPLVAK